VAAFKSEGAGPAAKTFCHCDSALQGLPQTRATVFPASALPVTDFSAAWISLWSPVTEQLELSPAPGANCMHPKNASISPTRIHQRYANAATVVRRLVTEFKKRVTLAMAPSMFCKSCSDAVIAWLAFCNCCVAF
jgi:hypothetical protein